MEIIQPGYTAPVEEGENFGTYDAISKTVEEHNQNAAPGEKYWGISIENSTYTVYDYGEVPTPPTEEEQMETLRAKKLEEASDACGAAITSGIDVMFGDGTQEHFSLEVPDQSNAVMLGATAYPLPCRRKAVQAVLCRRHRDAVHGKAERHHPADHLQQRFAAVDQAGKQPGGAERHLLWRGAAGGPESRGGGHPAEGKRAGRGHCEEAVHLRALAR